MFVFSFGYLLFFSQQIKNDKQYPVNNAQPFVGVHVTDIAANPAYQVANGNQETDYETIDDGLILN